MYYYDSSFLSYIYRMNLIIKFLFFLFLEDVDIHICEMLNSPYVKKNMHFDREHLE